MTEINNIIYFESDEEFLTLTVIYTLHDIEPHNVQANRRKHYDTD